MKISKVTKLWFTIVSLLQLGFNPLQPGWLHLPDKQIDPQPIWLYCITEIILPSKITIASHDDGRTGGLTEQGR